MKNTLKQIIQSTLLAGLLGLSSGCMSYHPISKYNHSKPQNFYSELGWRSAIETPVLSAHLSKEQKYVPIHPDDGGPGRGGRSLSIDSDIRIFDVKLGLEGSTGFERFRIKAGANASYFIPLYGGDVKNGYPKENDKSDRLASIKLQPLPYPYESYAYGQFRKITEFETEPFVGIEFFPGSDLGLSLEVSKPSATFKFEKGHWRWNSFEPIEKEAWKGRGTRYMLKADFYEKYYDCYEKTWGFFAGYEKYDAEFSENKTPVDSYIFGVVINNQ